MSYFDQIKKEFPNACTCGELTCFYCFEDSFNSKIYIGDSSTPYNSIDIANNTDRNFISLADVKKDDFESTRNVAKEYNGNGTNNKNQAVYTNLRNDCGGTVMEYAGYEGRNMKEKERSVNLDTLEVKITLCSENHRNQRLKHTNWIPPRSPYNLIQETLFHKPWQLLVATIFLNKTSARVGVPLFWKFVNKWTTPESLLNATIIEIASLMQPLGLNVKRALQIKRFTYEFLHKAWHYPIELSGIGKYGDDSYRIFCVNEWKATKPKDSKLKKYIAWLMENQNKLGI